MMHNDSTFFNIYIITPVHCILLKTLADLNLKENLQNVFGWIYEGLRLNIKICQYIYIYIYMFIL